MGDDDDGDDWPVLDSTVEYECPWFTVGFDTVLRPDGERADYYWVDPGDAVVVVPVTDAGEVVLVEEYRPNLGASVLTPPAGGVDTDESFAEAAGRELREETGFVADDLAHVGSFTPSARFRQEFGVVTAAGLATGDQDLDAGEFIEVHVEPFDVAYEAATTVPTLGWALVALTYARDAGVV